MLKKLLAPVSLHALCRGRVRRSVPIGIGTYGGPTEEQQARTKPETVFR